MNSASVDPTKKYMSIDSCDTIHPASRVDKHCDAWVILQIFDDQRPAPISQSAFPLRPQALLHGNSSEDLASFEKKIREKLYQTPQSNRTSCALITVYVVILPKQGLSSSDIDYLELRPPNVWPKNWRKVFHKEDPQAFEKRTCRLIQKVSSAYSNDHDQVKDKFTIGSEDVFCIALLNGSTIIELDPWKGSKILTQKNQFHDTWDHKFIDRPLSENLLLSVNVETPLKLKIHWEHSTQHVRPFSKMPAVYAWLEDPFGRNVYDPRRYTSVEVICARPRDTKLRGRTSATFKDGASCIVFNDLSVTSTGEHLLFFYCKPVVGDFAHHHSLPINSPILSAHMSPFQVVC